MPTAQCDVSDPLTWLPDDWAAFLAARGERPFRAMQVFRWIHRRGVADAEAMTDLGKSLRGVIAVAGLKMPAVIAELKRAADGTQKGLVCFADGRQVETVLIPALQRDDAEHGDDDADLAESESSVSAPARRTVTQCISSQVGCAMGCAFCASGVAGLQRNLSAGEIVSQVLLGRGALASDEVLRNVVLMGMGEPLHNYGNVERALRLLTHPEGIGLSNRRVTVSTSGLIPEIERLGRDFQGQISLAVSLHAPTDELRTSLMPINRRYPLAELITALKRYPMPPRRRITIEYTLIKGVNDSDGDARGLARLLRDVPVKINVIPMNPIADSPFEMPTAPVVESFQNVLRAAGYSVFVRRQRGDDIDAACGQLALRGAERKLRRLPTVPARGTTDAR